MECKVFSAELSEIQTLFAEAEAICKKVESNVSHDMAGVVIPSINQLRYAGQHLITACNSDKHLVQAEQLSKVKNHCCRAIYDAAEAACLVASSEMKDFKERFNDIIIVDTVSSYSQTLNVFSQLESMLTSKKGDIEKLEFYRQLSELNEKFHDGLVDLRAHEEELKKIQKNQRDANAYQQKMLENSNSSLYQGKFRISIAIIAILVSVIGLMFVQ